MANPQKENGYVTIANEVFEALMRFNIPYESRRVFDAIIRKTWGFNKKRDKLPLSQISKMTGLANKHVCRSLAWLKSYGMVLRDSDGWTSIQKDFDKWLVPNEGLPNEGLPNEGLPNEGLPNEGTASPYTGNKPVPIQGHSKDNTKDTIQKTSSRPAGGRRKSAREKPPKEDSLSFAKAAPQDFRNEWYDTTSTDAEQVESARRNFGFAVAGLDAGFVASHRNLDLAALYMAQYYRTCHGDWRVFARIGDRERIWNRDIRKWLAVAKMDPENDFVMAAMKSCAERGETIRDPVAFFKTVAENAHGGYEV